VTSDSHGPFPSSLGQLWPLGVKPAHVRQWETKVTQPACASVHYWEEYANTPPPYLGCAGFFLPGKSTSFSEKLLPDVTVWMGLSEIRPTL
jgi:hypothetical protein